jgi:hypothetical protein
MLLLIPLALAEEEVRWWGGGASVLGGFRDGAPTATVQTEVDGRIHLGGFQVRADVDVHLNPLDPTYTGLVTTPFSPEALSAGYHGDLGSVDVGVINPSIGIEEWDEWLNALPSHTGSFDAVQPGRIAGIMPGLSTGEGAALCLHIGQDLDWDAFTFGTSFASEQDAYSTYDGAWYYPDRPAVDGTLHAQTGGGLVSFQMYLTEKLTMDVSGHGGLWVIPRGFGEDTQVSPYAGSWFGLTYAMGKVSPVLRTEGEWDPDAVTGIPYATAHLGVRIDAMDSLVVHLEGTGAIKDKGFAPGGYAAVSLYRPEADAP